MKTILVVTPYLPYPNVGHAGGQAIFDFIFHLKSRGFKVCLVSMAWPDEASHIKSLQQLCDDTYVLISIPVFTDSFLRSFQTNPFLFFPRIMTGCVRHLMIRRRLKAGVNQMIQKHHPDVVQVEYSTMALYLSGIRSKRAKVAHLHDVMMKPYRRLMIAERKPLARLSRFLFYVLVKRTEMGFIRKFDKVLVKSEYDKRLLLSQGKFDVRVFPLGVQTGPAIVPYEKREPRTILFLGAMFRGVNETAALYFVDHVMAALEKEVGDVKFYIVGSSPSDQLRNLSSGKIIVTGFVDDVATFYQSCTVFVAPLFVGGGMILKVLQAMSFGLPVVSSGIANEGIMAADGEEILIANEPSEFSRKIASLLTDKELWRRISSRSQKFVNSRYSWDLVMNDYIRNVMDVEAG